MDKDEMKNRISLALKDPILQQGFEIICKNLVELEKENTELKAGSPKWHKVADGDLPKEDTTVLICYQGRGTIHYDIDYYCNKCFKWRDLRDIIAWREIPKYMEE